MTTTNALALYDKGPDRPWTNARLVSAAIVGHTTRDSVKLWVRAWAAGKYALLVSPREIPRGGVGTRPRVRDGKPFFVAADGTATEIPGCQLLSAAFTAETDFTHTFDLNGLSGSRRFYYAVFATDDNPAHNAWELPPDPQRRTFKLTTTEDQPLIFGLVSCHMPFAKNGDVQNHTMWERLYDVLDEADADLLVACGDQVYSDGTDRLNIWNLLRKDVDAISAMSREARIQIMRSWYRDIYRGYWGFRGLQDTFGRFASYMVWDDHEILDGWGSYPKDELVRKLALSSDNAIELAEDMFDAARLTYLEYQQSHNPPAAAGDAPKPLDPLDYSFDAQGAAFYVLDARTQRRFPSEKQATVLGDEQNKRLLAWLERPETAAARAVFIVTPAPIVHMLSLFVQAAALEILTAADDLRDQWEHESHWVERDIILDKVFKLSNVRGQPVVFLSGDVHVGAAFQLTDPGNKRARVFQVTSSPITRPIPAIPTSFTVSHGTLGGSRYRFKRLDVVGQNNFAIVSLRGAANAPQLQVNLYNRQADDEHIVKRKLITLTPQQ